MLFRDVEGTLAATDLLATLTSDTDGQVLEGNYTVRAHYYSNHSSTETTPVTGTVTIVINEGEEDQASESVAFSFTTDDSTNATPGGSGADWVDIADVDLVNGIITIF